MHTILNIVCKNLRGLFLTIAIIFIVSCSSGNGSGTNSVPLTSSEKVAQTAYIVNYGSNTVHKCRIGESGSLSNCIAENGVAGGLLSGPTGIAFNDEKTYAYITSEGSDMLTICSVNATNGELNECSNNAVYNTLYRPSGVAISNRTIYIVNHDDSFIICTVNNAALTNCVVRDSIMPDYHPNNIAVNKFESVPFYYITAKSNNHIVICNSILPDLALCNYSVSVEAATSMAFNKIASGTYAYITTQNNEIIKCKAGNGALNECTNISVDNIDNPSDIAFDESGMYAYISNFGSNKITICSVDSTSGDFNSCAVSDNNGFNNPIAIGIK